MMAGAEDDGRNRRNIAKTLRPFACGMFSACFATSIVHPVDLTKTRMQVAARGTSVMTILSKGYAENGVRSFYAGLSAALMRQAVYGCNRLALHRIFSDKLQERNGGAPITFSQKVASSLTAGGIAATLGNPFDVSLIRMQADSVKPIEERRNYKHVFDAVSRIIREEGVGRLWRGCGPTIIRAMAFNVGMMASYDEAKQFYQARYGAGTGTTLLSAATAGVSCSVLSLPFDFVKTRLQNMKPLVPGGAMPYKGFVDCVVQTYKADGILSFWRSFIPYYSRSAPHTMIVLMSLETVGQLYDDAFIGRDDEDTQPAAS